MIIKTKKNKKRLKSKRSPNQISNVKIKIKETKKSNKNDDNDNEKKIFVLGWGAGFFEKDEINVPLFVPLKLIDGGNVKEMSQA